MVKLGALDVADEEAEVQRAREDDEESEYHLL
jgi:hypothetical protein